ncbi:MAG: GNAT family N-acetyltransferase [Oscillospiraceae bacterium]|nr:GNAT family N-acetyltransferase [Oscillospiraceae bacterium]
MFKQENRKVYKTLSDGTEIVEYDDSLAPALADMWNQSRESWGGGNEVTTAEEIITDHAGGAFFNVFVAVTKEGEAVGYCSFKRYYKDEDTAYVNLLNVRPDYHGKKLGRELVLLCVEETIARGMPRLDIHTWPGNTKAVPLYKKCGFLWEDRSDSTHLSNYIPTVLKTGLFQNFFKTADWYADSSREIAIKPDGVKSDKFEFFDYEWEKDGEHLRVGFEKTGRRIRLVETDGYLIEMTAENHALAFGFKYRCTFRVVNKTGNALDIEIKGKNDGVIKFDAHWVSTVSSEAVFDTEFFVGEITEAQDEWRMHPCVLADVTVNGAPAEFGLGIEPKFPLAVSMIEKRLFTRAGMSEDVYFNIKNALTRSASVRFTLPDNALTRFGQAEFALSPEPGKDVSLKTTAHITACGYVSLPVTYNITLDTGEVFSFTRPLHIVNQGVDGQFAFETEDTRGAVNGPWRLSMDKKNNTIVLARVAPSETSFARFRATQIGKPYSEEFDLMNPADLRISFNGPNAVFEVDFASKAFDGALLTDVYEFSAAGVLNRRHRLSNTSQKTLDLHIKTNYWTNIERRAVLPNDGAFHEAGDVAAFCFSGLSSEKIDENWAFDTSNANPTGVFWPPEYKPVIAYDDELMFEHPTGELAPGGHFESKPVTYMCGVFTDFADFRSYVLGIHEKEGNKPRTTKPLEVTANGGNPVLSGSQLELSVRNNRLIEREGSVIVSSQDSLFTQETRETPEDEEWNALTFTVPITGAGVHTADFGLRFAAFEKDIQRALFVPDASRVTSRERDGVFTVTNGNIAFSAAPGYSDALFSLKYDGFEWLFSKYPEHVPYAWWNPFIGGVQTRFANMSNSLTIRERITAAFTEEADTFGNMWTGIRTDLTVENFERYKGISYSQYFLTLPGVPVLCHFTRFANNSGLYLSAEEVYTSVFLSGRDGMSDIYASVTNSDKEQFCLRMGGDDMEMPFDKLAVVTREGENPRGEALHIFKDAKRDMGAIEMTNDADHTGIGAELKISAEDGGTYTTCPVFLIFAEKDMTLESLTDLENIYF